jgi:hypothetical protein
MANNTGLDGLMSSQATFEPVSAKTQPVSGHTTCQIPDIENSCGRESSRKTPPSVGSARFSSPKTRPLPANPRECRRFSHTWKSHRRDRTGWLGRQDSNLGMAESPQVSLWMVCPGRLVYEAQCWIEVKAQAWLSERSNAHPVSFGRLATAS